MSTTKVTTKEIEINIERGGGRWSRNVYGEEWIIWACFFQTVSSLLATTVDSARPIIDRLSKEALASSDRVRSCR